MAIARSIFTKAVVTGTIFTRAQSRSVFGAVPRLIPEDGEDGVSPTVSIGTVTTLAAGSPATVANVGTPEAAVFNFGIPQGDQGNPGVVQAVVAGSNISVDNTDPANPVISSTSAVTSVNGATGVVVLTATDIGSSATGDVAATTVQGAIAELASEKLALAGGTMTGKLNTVASATGTAGLNIGEGAAPSSPVIGDMWLRTDGFFQIRVTGPATRTMAYLEGSSTFSGTKTFSVPPIFSTSTTSIASFRVPHGVAPSAPTNGDVWSESATGFWGRVNGVSVNFATVAGVAAAYQPLDSDLTSWAGVTRASGFDTFAATPSSANLRALLTDETGTGIAYFVGGALGTPSSATLTNGTGLPISTGLTGAGTGVLTALGVNVGSAGAFVTFNGALGTPSSGTLTNATGLPVSSGISGLGTNVATFLATPSSANLRAALTDEVGTGAAYFVGGALGTPASGDLSSCTQSTTSAAGVVELATTAETLTGTDTARAVTPAGLAGSRVFATITKGGTDQTAIPTGTDTKLTFGTEIDDVGGYWNTGTSKYIPPAGVYDIGGQIYISGGVVDQNNYFLTPYINGSTSGKSSGTRSSGTIGLIAVNIRLTLNGTDELEFYFNGGGAGDKTVGGNTTFTFITIRKVS